MAYSNVSYTGNGTTTTFAVPFPYIAQSDVIVTVAGATVPYTWPTPSTIQFTTAPANGAAVAIKRVTAKTQNVVFTDGGTLTAADLNASFLRELYISQEVSEGPTSALAFFSETLTVTGTNTLSALRHTPDGTFALLVVNQGSFMLPGGAFTLSGTTVNWNSGTAGFSLVAGYSVTVFYTYVA